MTETEKQHYKELRDYYDRHYPDGEYHYTCQDCEHCKMYAQRFVWEPAIREADGTLIVNKTNRYGYMHLCIRDLDHIKEVNSYDDVCEDHGELFREDE